jgi:lysophospholipase L1-like esterase
MKLNQQTVLKRFWAKPIQVSSYWHERLQLLPSQAILGHDCANVPVDNLGFRKTTINASSEFEKWVGGNGAKIVCIGGSTTFGYYSNFDESWPYYLEKKIQGSSVVNAGLVKGDLWQSARSLMDILRNGHRPDCVIFFDGVNQYSGFLQSREGYAEYRPVSPQYWNLRDIHKFFSNNMFQIFLVRVRIFIRNKKTFVLSSIPRKFLNRLREIRDQLGAEQVNQIPDIFIEGESELFLATKEVICRMLASYGIHEVYFFLQPTLYDVIEKRDPSGRFQYMKELYLSITSKDDSVIDLSKGVEGLLPDDFIDWVHTNAHGNEMIAEAIKRRIEVK